MIDKATSHVEERLAPCPAPPCEAQAVACVSVSDGGYHGGPDPRYYYLAAEGEVLHTHFTICKTCGYLSEYKGDGVYVITSKQA